MKWHSCHPCIPENQGIKYNLFFEGISGIVDKAVCIDTFYLDFCKAFDLGAGDILFKSILCRNKSTLLK